MVANTLWFRVPGGTWVDAYTRYGISLDDTAMSKLMTPAPNKDVLENKSDLEHGKRVNRSSDGVKKDERNVSIILNLTASTKAQFLTKYGLFCTEILDKGFFDIKTAYQDGVVYRMTYLDCTQFSEFVFGIGKYTLSLNEPDPTNRGTTDSWASV